MRNVLDGSQTTAAEKTTAAQEKWGKALEGGFQVVPNLLLRTQKHLGLSATDLTVLLNLSMHWWTRDNLPYLGPQVIADRMGVSKRTVERTFQRLEKRGIIHRLPSQELKQSLPNVRPISLSGLVEKLNAAAEFSLAAREHKRKEAGRKK